MKAKFVRGRDSRDSLGIGILSTQRFESLHLMKKWVDKILPIVFSSEAQYIADRLDKRRYKNLSVNSPENSIYIVLFDLLRKFFENRNDVYISPSKKITLDEILNSDVIVESLAYETIWRAHTEYWDKRFKENPEERKEMQRELHKN